MRRASPLRFSRQRLGAWRERLILDDGREFFLRPIEPADAGPLRAGFAKLEPEEVRLRFLHPMTELTEAYARELCTLDPTQAFALILAETLPPGQAQIGAVVRMAINHELKAAEFAIIVGRPLAGFGLGKHLLRRLVDYCRRRGLRAIFGDVLIENSVMLNLADRLGFRHVAAEEPGQVRVWKDL